MAKKPIQPTDESTRHYIEYTWKDIHHSRLQNWTAITVVTAFHIGILKIIEFYMNDQPRIDLFILMLTFGALFCLVGFLITRKHQNQLYKGLKSIRMAQIQLGTNSFRNDRSKSEQKKLDNEKSLKSLLKKNFWTAGAFLSYYFLLLLILDIICIINIESLIS